MRRTGAISAIMIFAVLAGWVGPAYSQQPPAVGDSSAMSLPDPGQILELIEKLLG